MIILINITGHKFKELRNILSYRMIIFPPRTMGDSEDKLLIMSQ